MGVCEVFYKVYKLRFDPVEITYGPRAMLSIFAIKRAKYYALNWFNCLIVCPF